jgi:hypothetical protein
MWSQSRLVGIALLSVAGVLTQWAFRFHLAVSPVDSFIRLLICMADVLLIIPSIAFIFSGQEKLTTSVKDILRYSPTLVSIYIAGIAVYVTILAVEFGCRYHFRNHYEPPHREYTYWNPSPNPVKVKGDTIVHRYFVNDTLVYDHRYAVDSLGRRHVPLQRPDSTYREFAILAGCSFMFGYGVADEGTFAHAIDSLQGLRPYNYAVSGQGPQHLLTMLRDSDLVAQVNEPNGRLIYLYIDDHIPRLIGSRRLIKMWARHFPYFSLKNNELVQDGTFTTGRPVLTAIYRILTHSAFIDLFDIEIPRWTFDSHLRLAAAVFAASQDEFKRQFPDGDFLIVIGPNSLLAPRLIRFLDEYAVPYVDHSQLLDKEQPEYKIHRTEGHPNGRYYWQMAKELKLYFGKQPLP